MGRLAIVMNMLAPYWVDVFDGLAERGWELRVIVGLEKEAACKYDMNDVRLHGFSVKRCANLVLDLNRLPGKSGYLHFPYGLWQELRAWKPDVIVTSELGMRTLIGKIYGSIHAVPVIPWACLSPHTERNNSRLRERFRRWLLEGAPAVCTNMSEASCYLVDSLKVPAGKIFQTPYTVDVEKYHERVEAFRFGAAGLRNELGLSGAVFLYVGQMTSRKGLAELARGIITLPSSYRSRSSFLFIGGEIPPHVREMLDQSGIRFVGIPFVQPGELPRYYALADAFVFPSLEDEWGIVLNEAAAAGIPLVASRFASATAELVKHGHNGLVFDPHDTGGIARTLAEIIDLPDFKRKAWGANSVEAAGRIGLHFTIDNLDAAFRSALAGSGNLHSVMRNGKER